MSNTSESKVLANLYDRRDMWNDFFIDHIVKLKTPENAELIQSLMVTFSEIKTISEKIGRLKELTNEGLND
jgi:hypothetical protein